MATATTTATQTFTVEIPADKVAFVKTFFKELGFSFKKEKAVKKKSAIERGLEDLEAGRYFSTNDPDELIAYLNK